MRYYNWRTSRKVEKEYLRALGKLLEIFKKYAKSSKGNVGDFSRKLNQFQNSEAFDRYINSITRRMVLSAFNVQARTWREAARKATKSKAVYSLLLKDINTNMRPSIDAQVNRNAYIISTLPNDVALKVTKDIEKATFEGLRPKAIEQLIIDKTSQHAGASASLIARTEVAKTQTALNRARSERVGAKWYVWRTAEDGAVRDSHRLMNDVVVAWQDPPAPEILAGEQPPKNNTHYHAGEIYNCRCYPEVLLDIDDIEWPHKVHQAGKIVRMSKKQFTEIF